ncbi:hypothetical protein [Streptomyces acidiscabies]|uniref:Uncharacterized protein n=1 Tax=Streptomyces acidiscabies TaxID=42234 RepID=A0A0L0KFD3_9ACTN|nr:hypothetical protein [Streptomyces acidiscabies]KND36531.1 hypothetical protein IQ63_12360 [Streptomyces acidiscabies]
MTETFRSDRTFRVWHYTATHGDRLLLRATVERGKPRVDLHVAGVRGVLLESRYDGIVIREGTPDQRQEIGSFFGIVIDEMVNVHIIGEDRMTGFIVGGPLRWHEDEGSFIDPSHFGFIPGTL